MNIHIDNKTYVVAFPAFLAAVVHVPKDLQIQYVVTKGIVTRAMAAKVQGAERCRAPLSLWCLCTYK